MSDRKRGRPPEPNTPPDHQSQPFSYLPQPEQWMPWETGRFAWEALPPPGPQGMRQTGGGGGYSGVAHGLAAHTLSRLPPSPRSRPFPPPPPLEPSPRLSLDLSYSSAHHAATPASSSSAAPASSTGLTDGLRLLAVASRAAPPPLYPPDPLALPLSGGAPPRHPSDAPPPLPPPRPEPPSTPRDALVKETISRAFLALAMQGLADGGKTYMFIRRWQVSRARLDGEDPSNGLHEAVTWAERQGKLVFSDDAKDDDTQSATFLHEPPEDANNDLASCRVWSACVGGRELVVRCSLGFGQRFFNTQDLVSSMRDTRQLCLFAWARLMSEEEDLVRFYSALMEVMFSRTTAATNIIINKCRERAGGQRRCLMRLSFHSCVLADGRTFNGYQVQIWPLGHAPLRHPPPLNIGQDPAPPMVV